MDEQTLRAMVLNKMGKELKKKWPLDIATPCDEFRKSLRDAFSVLRKEIPGGIARRVLMRTAVEIQAEDIRTDSCE